MTFMLRTSQTAARRIWHTHTHTHTHTSPSTDNTIESGPRSMHGHRPFLGERALMYLSRIDDVYFNGIDNSWIRHVLCTLAQKQKYIARGRQTVPTIHRNTQLRPLGRCAERRQPPCFIAILHAGSKQWKTGCIQHDHDAVPTPSKGGKCALYKVLHRMLGGHAHSIRTDQLDGVTAYMLLSVVQQQCTVSYGSVAPQSQRPTTRPAIGHAHLFQRKQEVPLFY